jgi:hypothetical protein
VIRVLVLTVSVAAGCAPPDASPGALQTKIVASSVSELSVIDNPPAHYVNLFDAPLGTNNAKRCNGKLRRMDIENATVASTFCEISVGGASPAKLQVQSVLSRTYLEMRRRNPHPSLIKGNCADRDGRRPQQLANQNDQEVGHIRRRNGRKHIYCANQDRWVDAQEYAKQIEYIQQKQGVVLATVQDGRVVDIPLLMYGNCDAVKDDHKRWCHEDSFAGQSFEQILGNLVRTKYGGKPQLARLVYADGGAQPTGDALESAERRDEEAVQAGDGASDSRGGSGYRTAPFPSPSDHGGADDGGTRYVVVETTKTTTPGSVSAPGFRYPVRSAGTTPNSDDTNNAEAEGSDRRSAASALSGGSSPEPVSQPHCAGPDICNGKDDDCDSSTIDGSGDERLFERCELPDDDEPATDPSSVLLVSSEEPEGTLICRAGELICVDELGRSAFERVLTANSPSAAEPESDCPLQARLSANPLGASGGWVVSLLLLLRLRRRRGRLSRSAG